MSALSAKLIDRLSIGGLNSCWEWQGARQSAGYGTVRDPNDGKNLLVHRAAYEEWHGPIPEGLTLDHLCRNRACGNPKHLEPVTRGENVMRGDTIPARNAAKTHCVNGHEFSSENTFISQGARHCRACARARGRK